jgi:hypothetical protein
VAEEPVLACERVLLLAEYEILRKRHEAHYLHIVELNRWISVAQCAIRRGYLRPAFSMVEKQEQLANLKEALSCLKGRLEIASRGLALSSAQLDSHTGRMGEYKRRAKWANLQFVPSPQLGLQ